MSSLYNCRHSGDQFRITKFTPNFDVESSYLTTITECDCPAGHRPTCRHREMLPKFIARDHIGDEWFYDFDRGGWVQGEISAAGDAIEAPPLPPLPDGVQVFGMGDVLGIHNAIADAVGEPEARINPAAQAHITPARALPSAPTIRRRI